MTSRNHDQLQDLDAPYDLLPELILQLVNNVNRKHYA